MTRLKVLIASLFAVALATGVVVGMGVARVPKPHDRGSWLSEELNLTSSQSEEMRVIWSDISHPGQGSFDRRRQFQKERDETVQALLTEDQKAGYLKVIDKYNEQIAELNHEREQAFQAAVESTKAILTDTQRVKYDELMKSGFRGSPRDRGEGGRRGASTRRGGGMGGGMGNGGFGGGSVLEVPAATRPDPPG